jgi:hypothetical protein
MDFAAIELNDASVTLARDGLLRAQSPGYALIEQDVLTVGEPALRQARLKPRMVSTRFWDRLSTDPVFPAIPTGFSFADLARAHLSHVWAQGGHDTGGLILVVPGYFERRQLGLLLGIAEQLTLPVCGMVDSGLAACSPHAEEGLVVHVDIHLHRSVITGIEVHDEARRIFHRSLDGHGLVQLFDGWVRLIADSFVQTTRFDPLHRADSEQAIYDRLPSWLAALKEQDAMGVQMAARDGGVHVTRLTRSQFVEHARGFYARLGSAIGELCGERSSTLHLADAAARLPGLAEALCSPVDRAARLLPSGAGALGALRHASQIADGGWRNTLTVRLPRHVLARDEATGNNP